MARSIHNLWAKQNQYIFFNIKKQGNRKTIMGLSLNLIFQVMHHWPATIIPRVQQFRAPIPLAPPTVQAHLLFLLFRMPTRRTWIPTPMVLETVLQYHGLHALRRTFIFLWPCCWVSNTLDAHLWHTHQSCILHKQMSCSRAIPCILISLFTWVETCLEPTTAWPLTNYP